MTRSIFWGALAGALLLFWYVAPVSARPICNGADVMRPCAPKFSAERVSKREARQSRRADRFRNVEFGSPMYPPETQRSFLNRQATILPHPAGCPSRAFCGCGAAVEVFGKPIRSLWLAANWLRFPRVPKGMEAPGHAAARRGHVFVIKQVLGGGKVLAYDANSGGRRTRLHVRSLAGFAVVDPHG